MTDYERRKELLNQTKQNDDLSDLKAYKEEDRPKGSLGIRVIICMVCFICYILFDYGNMKILNVNSKVVTNQIKKEMNLQDLNVKNIMNFK